VHSQQHIETVRSACIEGKSLDADTQTSPHSFEAAVAAASVACTVAQNQGFALVRPPGHHGYGHKSTGFCLFNAIAIAVQSLLNENQKVMVLDFDGHLGDGTSDIFYANSDVLFCSMHQYPAFPGNGWVDEIGNGEGKGYTINIPIPPGSGDDAFEKALNFLLPIARQFNPQVVAVSAGFDGHLLDPLLQLNYSLHSFYKVGQWLTQNFERVFAVLEGGYNLDVLPKAIQQFLNGVNKLPANHPDQYIHTADGAMSRLEDNLALLQKNLAPYWSL
jgi:acetoin utilization deacetylase AcuC-like enzyme